VRFPKTSFVAYAEGCSVDHHRRLLAGIRRFVFGTSVRQRFGEVTQRPYHDHQDVRQFVIKAALADASQPIVMIGDSITEMAPLPAEIAGHPVVDAGIGGISTSGYKLLAGRLFESRTLYLAAIDAASPV
jgi:hypothetical protein